MKANYLPEMARSCDPGESVSPPCVKGKSQLILKIRSDIICSVRSRTSRVIVTLVLLTCFVCPVLEMFDRWDHTLRTGQDTEYTFVVIALCVGAVFAFARLIVTFCASLSATKYIWTPWRINVSLFSVIHPAAFGPLSESPPLNLRI